MSEIENGYFRGVVTGFTCKVCSPPGPLGISVGLSYEHGSSRKLGARLALQVVIMKYMVACIGRLALCFLKVGEEVVCGNPKYFEHLNVGAWYEGLEGGVHFCTK